MNRAPTRGILILGALFVAAAFALAPVSVYGALVEPATRTVTTAADASVIYVSTAGSDANPGTISKPLRTLQRAARIVVPGQRVYVRAGKYDGFTLTRSGLSGKPITIRSYPGERAVISGDSGRTHVVALQGVHHVTLSHLTVQDGRVRQGSGVLVERSWRIKVSRNVLRRNDSFGVLLEGSTSVIVRDNSISHNATGVRVRYGGEGVLIRSNRIFHNDRMTVNDSQPGNDTGGQGIAFEKTSGGAVARDNRIWGNRAKSIDWGEDGAAFEIFGASNVLITRNRVWNNRAVLETGTNSLYACVNNRFTRNVAWRSTTKTSVGLVLRCAEDGLIAHNTFDSLTWWAMQLSHKSGSFGASIGGLTVVNNIVYGIKSFHIDTSLPNSVVLDYNLVWAPDKHVAYVAGRGYTYELAQFREWTGHEDRGISAAPRFVDRTGHNYKLRGGSPAIDRGIRGVLPSGYHGLAPDLGRYEYRAG